MTKEKLSKRDQATEIIQLLREDNREEALRLFEKYEFRKEFIRFVIKRGFDHDDASDLVQKFIVDKLTMKSDSIKNIEFARTWMYRVLRNMIIDQGRMLKKNRVVPLDENRDQSQAPKIYEEKNQTPSDCVQEQLAIFRESEPKYAETLELILNGLGPEEIRLVIGRSYGATREFMSQCRKKFRPFIEICNEIEE